MSMNVRLVRSGVFAGTAFLLGVLVMGAPYWALPYHAVSLPSSLYGTGLLVMMFGAFALSALRIVPWWVAAILMGSVAPSIVMARVTVECSTDPTLHNLWPIEIVVASFVSYPLTLACVLLGWLVGRYFPRRGARRTRGVQSAEGSP